MAVLLDKERVSQPFDFADKSSVLFAVAFSTSDPYVASNVMPAPRQRDNVFKSHLLAGNTPIAQVAMKPVTLDNVLNLNRFVRQRQFPRSPIVGILYSVIAALNAPSFHGFIEALFTPAVMTRLSVVQRVRECLFRFFQSAMVTRQLVPLVYQVGAFQIALSARRHLLVAFDVSNIPAFTTKLSTFTLSSVRKLRARFLYAAVNASTCALELADSNPGVITVPIYCATAPATSIPVRPFCYRLAGLTKVTNAGFDLFSHAVHSLIVNGLVRPVSALQR